MILRIAVCSCLILLSQARTPPKCRDTDMNCAVWVATNQTQCEDVLLIQEHCQKTCGICDGNGPIDPKYDVKRVPKHMAPIAWMLGKWRSEFGGKAFFPTIPKFTYGEQIDISLGSFRNMSSAFNYTAFAWDINMPEGDPIEIHSENGYIVLKHDEENDVDKVALTTAMSNGFMTVEEGEVGPNQLKFTLQRIGRISFSHDSAVRTMFREWTLLDETHLESRLIMSTTVTRKLMEHTAIIYKKLYP